LVHAGQAVLTYFGSWELVEQVERHELGDKLYVAPGNLAVKEALPFWHMASVAGLNGKYS